MKMQNNMFDLPATPAPVTLAKFNEDGYSVKGCTIIYAPKGQAGEYSPLATNPYRGCGHACAYCYVPQVIKMMDRAVFDAGAVPRPGFLDNLKKDARKYQALGSTGQVMLSFTSDVYNPFDTSLTRPTIEVLKAHGLGFSVLTKGGSRALADIDLYRPDRDAFASTLTSLDDKFSKLWERGAALPQDRMDTLKKFHEAGIFTWVSCEPTLDIEATLAIIEQTRGYVDFFKIGRVNYVGLTKTTDWESFTHRVIDLCQKYDIKHYIKLDLQKYLPAGYPNVMRINQHN